MSKVIISVDHSAASSFSAYLDLKFNKGSMLIMLSHQTMKSRR